MAISTLNLPVPAGDGVGAWVDVSSIAPERTFTIDVGTDFEGDLFIDAACTAGGAPVDPNQFTPVLRFNSTSQRKVTGLLACNFLRVRREKTRPENPTVPTVNVGGDTAGAAVFGVLALTPSDGVGAALDISAGGEVLTILAAGTFNRAVYIEGSNDAGATFARIEDFGVFEAAEQKTAKCIFERARAASEKSGGGDAPIIMIGSMALASLGGAPFPGFGSIVTVDASANADGVAGTAARSDHKHEVATGSPVGVGAANAGGASDDLARADHVHAGVSSANGATGAFTTSGPVVDNTTPLAPTFQNKKTKTLPGGFVSADIDTNVNLGFIVPKLSANLVMPAPTNTLEGRIITFEIQQETTTRTVTWNAAYQFAKAGTEFGVTLAQFNTLLASMLNDETLKIAFERSGRKGTWVCVALAGPYA